MHQHQIENLEEQRIEMQEAIKNKLDVNQAMFNNLVEALDRGIESDDLDSSINTLEDFALTFGKKLKLSKFDEFDNFMLSNDTLKL